jgi:glycosyltransferase involved in cell wall biosynthesis
LVITAVGGLPAAVADYGGAILVPPRDAEELRDAIRRLPDLTGRRYQDPHSWDLTVTRLGELMEQLGYSLGTCETRQKVPSTASAGSPGNIP